MRANVKFWSLWSFYIYLFKIYICMYTSIYRPITAPTCCENMTKMTKGQKALSFQCFIMVMQMTKHDHGNDHSLHSYISVTSDIKSHDQNDQSFCRHLNDNLVYVNIVDNHLTKRPCAPIRRHATRRGDWALRGLGISTQGLHKLFFILKICYKTIYV